MHYSGCKGIFFVFAAIVASTINIIIFYNIEYSKSQISNVPIGWDTPNYVASINHLKKTADVYQILKQYDNNNFMYYFIASILPFDATSIEIYLPIFLVAASVISLGFFTNILTRSILITCACMLFSSTWFGLYRASDLHAQILSIPLTFFALGLFLKRSFKHGPNEILGKTQSDRIKTKRYGLIVSIIILVASFTHFETTVFLVLVVSLTFTLYNFHLKEMKSLLWIVIPILPSIMAYSIHLSNPVLFPPSIRIIHEPISYSLLWSSFGGFLPLIMAGFVSSCFLLTKKVSLMVRLDKQSYFFIVFALIWFALSLVIFRTDFFVPTIYSYSYRAATLLPVPLLACIPFLIINSRTPSKSSKSIAVYSFSVLIIILFTYMSYASLFRNEVQIGTIHYMPRDSFEEIYSLSKIPFREKPIIVYYPYVPGVSEGGMSEYPDNWVSAIIGDHYRYLGDVKSLVSAKETPFDDVYSRYYSYRYIKQMIDDGVWNPATIAQSPILVLDNFYNIELINQSSGFHPLIHGIHLYRPSKDASDYYRLDAVRTAIDNQSPWYIVSRNFTSKNDIHTMLETYTNSSQKKQLSFRIYFDPNTCYQILMRYIDGPSSFGFRVFANGLDIGSIFYKGSGKLKATSFNFCPSSNWVKISVDPFIADSKAYASLDNVIGITSKTISGDLHNKVNHSVPLNT